MYVHFHFVDAKHSLIFVLFPSRLIKINSERGVNRDLFSYEEGGFDQHFDLKSGLPGLFGKLDSPLRGFRQALITDGLWDSVTVVMTVSALSDMQINS